MQKKKWEKNKYKKKNRVQDVVAYDKEQKEGDKKIYWVECKWKFLGDTDVNRLLTT